MSLPLGRKRNANNPDSGYRSTSEPLDPLTELDEYGTELHREARVWKVYVKEADKYDGELVKSWNDSADVILVFAALFSAISSAFLVESSKMLHKDLLLVISQTLISIVNGTQVPGSTSPPNGTFTDFAPSRVAIWVNTLWYLSLSLSLATSFVAILAKDWCHSFMKDRTGHPFEQTRRRQKKWDMIVRWKMPELLAFLPSLIHLALLLFAIGMCIMLWETHVVVAIPVICVAGVALAFYISSSITASLVDWFPYPTIISRIYRTELRQLLWQILCELIFLAGFILASLPAAYILSICAAIPGAISAIRNILDIPDNDRVAEVDFWRLRNPYAGAIDLLSTLLGRQVPKLRHALLTSVGLIKGDANSVDHSGTDDTHPKDDVSSRALSWLITSCEEPQSVDIALQSIAGATNRIPRLSLLECKAPLQILRRLASSSLYRRQDSKSDAVVSLYVRALSFLGTSASSDPDNRRKERSKLETLIWDLQTVTEKKVAALIEEGNFDPTQSNVDALRIGSTVASKTLKLLQNELGSSAIVPILDSIAELLKFRRSPDTTLHDAAVLSLAHAATLLLLVAPASIATRQDDSDLPLELLTIGRNFPTLFGGRDDVGTHPLLSQCIELVKEHNSGLIVGLATTCILLYNTHEDQTRPLERSLSWSEQVVQGLIQMHFQDDAALMGIYKVDPPGISAPEKTPDLRDYISRLGEKLFSNNPPRISIVQGGQTAGPGLDQKVVLVQLHALSSISHLTSTPVLSPAIYLFVVEVMCRTAPSSALFVCGVEMLSKHPFPTLSDELATALEQRDLVPLLEETSASKSQTKWYFAQGQLWLILSLYIYGDGTASRRDKLKAQLDKCRKDGDKSEKDRHRCLGWELWRQVRPGYITARELGVWAWRLNECVWQSRGDAMEQSLCKDLRDVPSELRGLSSFTAWPRRVDDLPTNGLPRVEDVKDEMEERAGVTHATMKGKSTTDGDIHSQSAGRIVGSGEATTQGEEDAGRVYSSQDLEVILQGPKGGAGGSVTGVDRQGEVFDAQGKENDGVEAVGDGRRVADAGGGIEAINGPQSEGEEAMGGNNARHGGNEGHYAIDIDGVED